MDALVGEGGAAGLEVARAHHGPANHRYALRLADGAEVEAVVYRGDSACVSVQVGCAVGCPFCASGRDGLARNLSFAELVAQVETLRRLHPSVVRLTVSGVGEPLHNLAATAGLIGWARERALAVSLTTSGGPLARLAECLELPHRGVTISVHAGFAASRARLVPRGPALAALFPALAAALAGQSASRRRKIALAFLLLDGLNDGDDELDAFAALALPLGVKVQLYRHNPIPGDAGPTFRTDPERFQRAYRRLAGAGLDVRRSSQARLQANGGCGTLRAAAPARPISLRGRSGPG